MPVLTEKDVRRGFFSLVNQGVVPKNVDLTPVLARPPIYRLKSARIHSKKGKKESVSMNNIKSNNFFITEKIVDSRKREKTKILMAKKPETCLNYREIIMIQTYWRSHSRKRWFKRIVLMIRKMQKLVRKTANLNRLKGLLEKRKKEVMEKYELVQNSFKLNWKNEKHIEIIINCSQEKVTNINIYFSN